MMTLQSSDIRPIAGEARCDAHSVEFDSAGFSGLSHAEASQHLKIERTAPGMNILASGFLYFGCVFGVGFLLGAIRVAWLVPRLGVRLAELLEMPLMFLVILMSARWVVRRCRLAPVWSVRLGTGAVALALLVSAEIVLACWLQGISVRQYLETRDPVSGSVYLLMLGVFTIMPILVKSRDESRLLSVTTEGAHYNKGVR